MTDFAVAGGVYREKCVIPDWDEFYGSAGRAAACVSNLVDGEVSLHTYVGERSKSIVESFASIHSIRLHATTLADFISFEYFYPLSIPEITPDPNTIKKAPPLKVASKVALRYGMLEGDAIIDAETAIYDPQAKYGATGFTANGSRAKRLALVLNQSEAFAITGQSAPDDIFDALRKLDRADVIVLKQGPYGCLVSTDKVIKSIPAYMSESVWKIGSGDVFSATFAALWGVRNCEAFEAADAASRATAFYVNSRSLPVPDHSALKSLDLTPIKPGKGRIYLAGPFFDIAQRWLIEEIRIQLRAMGAQVFSPIHDVGPGAASHVVPKDIEGIEKSNVMLAVVNGADPGTIFEIGYATKLGIPVVAIAMNMKPEDLKMLAGTGSEIIDELTTAIYKAVWKLQSK